jgi:integrase
VPGFRFHDLRHTFVSLLIRSGADVRQVASWAGHSSPVVTLNVYAHLFEGDEDAAADRMDALMSEPVPEPVSIKAAKA